MDTTPEVRSPTLRVGDSERNACAVTLIEHHLQGRLSREDLESRQRLAMAAVTDDDLRLLLADLPRSDVTPLPSRNTGPLSARSADLAKALRGLLLAGPVLAVAAVAQPAWQYSGEGHFITATVAGAVGYATHAVSTRLRR